MGKYCVGKAFEILFQIQHAGELCVFVDVEERKIERARERERE